ncbi:MAG: hypothetical protein H7X70_03670 [Candidatus Kapabacteria bacterium]|nr:hypothetical protein [Candidatus Kapabacteria bacterium]
MRQPKILALLCVIAVFTTGIQARDARGLISKGPALTKKAYEGVQATALNIDKDLMRSIAINRDATLTVDLPVDGRVLTLNLVRHDVLPFTTPLTVMTDRGPELRSTRSIAVYRGAIPGAPNSIVSLVVTPTTVIGMIDARGYRTVIGPDRERSGVFVAATINSSDATSKLPCQTPDDAVSQHVLDIMRETYAKPHDKVQANDTLLMEVAVEADYQLYTGMGKDLDIATAYIAQLFSVASQIYERDLQTKMQISFVRIWSVSNDPYSDQADVFGLIDPYKAYYRANMDTVKRDIALLLTMRGPIGGIAGSIGGLCDPNGSYAACDIANDLKQLPTYSWDALVVAHEIGHVCGGVHTHSCYWPGGPLDSCIASEAGNCLTWEQARPMEGTIMSYCNQNGSIEMAFHVRHKSTLRNFIERAACIGGRTITQSNVVTGRVLDAVTKQPIRDATITIRSYNDDTFMNTLQTQGDSISITDANGRYRFERVGAGIIMLRLPYTYMLSQYLEIDYDNSDFILVAESLNEHDILVEKAQPITVEFAIEPNADDIQFYLVGEKLRDFYAPILLSKFEKPRNNYPRTFSLTPGIYTLLPKMAGRIFEPETVTIVVPADRPADTVRIKVTKDNATVPLMQVVALTLFEDENRRLSLSPNESGRLINYSTGAVAASLSSGDRSAFYKTGVSTNSAFTIEPAYDTSQFVASSYPPYLYTWSGMNQIVKRVRAFPLAARPFVFRAFSSTWSPISNGRTIIDSGSRIAVREAIPFEFRFGEKLIDTMYIKPNGYVYAGPDEINDSRVNSIPRANMVLLPLANDCFPRFDSVKGAVLTEVRGTAPSRVFVIEWKNLGKQELSPYTSYWVGALNFQLHIHEGTGAIEYVYGPMDTPKGIEFGANVGMRGKDVLDLQCVKLTVGGVQGWSKVHTVFTAPSAAFTLNSNRKPESGQTYRFALPTTSVEEDAPEKTLSVSPNPASDAVLAQWPLDLHIYAIEIVDVRGAVVDHASVASTTSSLKIDVSKLTTGSYWIVAKGASTITTPFTVTR